MAIRQLKDEARAIPEEDLHLVLRLADEDEQMTLVGIVAQRALDAGTETVDAVAHVAQLGGEIDASARR